MKQFIFIALLAVIIAVCNTQGGGTIGEVTDLLGELGDVVFELGEQLGIDLVSNR